MTLSSFSSQFGNVLVSPPLEMMSRLGCTPACRFGVAQVGIDDLVFYHNGTRYPINQADLHDTRVDLWTPIAKRIAAEHGVPSQQDELLDLIESIKPLLTYTQHRPGCDMFGSAHDCSCGLRALLKPVLEALYARESRENAVQEGSLALGDERVASQGSTD